MGWPDTFIHTSYYPLLALNGIRSPPLTHSSGHGEHATLKALPLLSYIKERMPQALCRGRVGADGPTGGLAMSTGCRSLPQSFLEISGRKSQVSMVWEGSARLQEDNFSSRYAFDLGFTPGSLVMGQVSSLCPCSEAALCGLYCRVSPGETLQENREDRLK